MNFLYWTYNSRRERSSLLSDIFRQLASGYVCTHIYIYIYIWSIIYYKNIDKDTATCSAYVYNHPFGILYLLYV